MYMYVHIDLGIISKKKHLQIENVQRYTIQVFKSD